ncbi:MAG: TIGR04086 family membrane protein [Oscillospiraceae bacterium]|nr:TIGR04086 family membrane protein [Oscillospiraceae bacterium]
MRFVVRSLILRGIPLSAAGMFAAATLFAEIDLPAAVQSALANLPVMFGAWASAFYAGKRLRRGGILCGIYTSLLLSGGWYFFAGCHAGFGFPLCIVLALPCGIWGGITGVNRPAPAVRRRIHAAARILKSASLSTSHAAAVRRTSRNHPR